MCLAAILGCCCGCGAVSVGRHVRAPQCDRRLVLLVGGLFNLTVLLAFASELHSHLPHVIVAIGLLWGGFAFVQFAEREIHARKNGYSLVVDGPVQPLRKIADEQAAVPTKKPQAPPPSSGANRGCLSKVLCCVSANTSAGKRNSRAAKSPSESKAATLPNRPRAPGRNVSRVGKERNGSRVAPGQTDSGAAPKAAPDREDSKAATDRNVSSDTSRAASSTDRPPPPSRKKSPPIQKGQRDQQATQDTANEEKTSNARSDDAQDTKLSGPKKWFQEHVRHIAAVGAIGFWFLTRDDSGTKHESDLGMLSSGDSSSSFPDLPTWAYWVIGGGVAAAVSSLCGVRYCCKTSGDEDAGCAAKTRMAPMVSKLKKATGIHPNIIILLIVCAVAAVMFFAWYRFCHKSPEAGPIIPLWQDNANAVRVSLPKAQRLQHFQKIFGHEG